MKKNEPQERVERKPSKKGEGGKRVKKRQEKRGRKPIHADIVAATLISSSGTPFSQRITSAS